MEHVSRIQVRDKCGTIADDNEQIGLNYIAFCSQKVNHC